MATIKELAKTAGFDVNENGEDVWISDGYYKDELERFAELIRQDEREQCAKVCENVSELTNRTFQGIAEVIRARSK